MFVIGGVLLGLAIVCGVATGFLLRGLKGALVAPIIPLLVLLAMSLSMDAQELNDFSSLITGEVMLIVGVPLALVAVLSYAGISHLRNRRSPSTDA